MEETTRTTHFHTTHSLTHPTGMQQPPPGMPMMRGPPMMGRGMPMMRGPPMMGRGMPMMRGPPMMGRGPPPPPPQ